MDDRAAPGPAATEEERTAWSFSLLLTPDELPGSGWTVVEERSWPTGGLDATSETGRRALEAGGITAWRRFADGQGHEAWVEVVPYATADDARVARVRVPTYFVGVAPPGGTVVEELVVADRRVRGARRPVDPRQDDVGTRRRAPGPDGGRCGRNRAGPDLHGRPGRPRDVGRGAPPVRRPGGEGHPGPHPLTGRIRRGRSGRGVRRGVRKGGQDGPPHVQCHPGEGGAPLGGSRSPMGGRGRAGRAPQFATAAIPAIGASSRAPPSEPSKGAPPKANTPPSAPTSQ